ncbi:hypothetical protein AGMMS4952_20450 [Spirochaetia bacterium]|nr:hypothetical protein AGMMS4952_20450 [Spirochaetia bacterium]
MSLKNCSIGVFLALALGVSAQGATVSFVVIETGLREETPPIASSRLWEDALLGVFFDSGHIVSNTPIRRIPEKPPKNLPDEARVSLDSALEGGADFFILAMLDYQNPLRTGEALPKPQNVSIRLFKTEPYRFLFSMEYNLDKRNTGEGPFKEGSVNNARTADKDELTGAMDAARAMAKHLKD